MDEHQKQEVRALSSTPFSGTQILLLDIIVCYFVYRLVLLCIVDILELWNGRSKISPILQVCGNICVKEMTPVYRTY